ncbi:hypothetical protein [Alkalibacterium sp.]
MKHNVVTEVSTTLIDAVSGKNSDFSRGVLNQVKHAHDVIINGGKMKDD